MHAFDRHGIARRAATTVAAAGAIMAVMLGMIVSAVPAGAQTITPTYRVIQILSGQSLHHWYTKAGSSKRHSEPLTSPDDITRIGGYLFTGFQNGVGPAGAGEPGREPAQHDRGIHPDRPSGEPVGRGGQVRRPDR